LNHLNTHELKNESQLRLYTDLAILLEKYPSEILNSSLTDLSGKLGMNEILSSKLIILKEFHGVTIPAFLDEFIKRWKQEGCRSLFIQFVKNPKQEDNYNRKLLYRKLVSDIPGFHRRIIYILGDIFPTPEFMKNRYGCKTKFHAFLYYPHRLGKLFWLLR
jgi:hypothetical protein